MDWYEEYIEEGIRGIVKLLRDNGFNTTWSCHHEMCVQGDLMLDGEMNRLHKVLYNNGHREYTIEQLVHVENGYIVNVHFTINFQKQ